VILTLVLTALLAQAGTGTTEAKSPPPPTPAAPTAQADSRAPSLKGNIEEDPGALLRVKRIYVDSFGEDIVSKELQSMIVSALSESKRFRVTEYREKADAVLKGVALEKTSQEIHAYGESTAVGGAAGSHHGEVSGSVVDGTGHISGSSSGGFVAHHAGTSDSSLNTETINEARIAVRLVNPDGDVIWTSTQESKGAKYKGASADIASKCVKQLLKDVEKLERATSTVPLEKPTSAAAATH